MHNDVIRYFSRVSIALSVLLNVLLGGPSNQTLSARNYALKRVGKPNIVWLIDLVFFWEKDHCMTSWLYWFLHRNMHLEILEMNEEKSNG